MCIIGKCNKEYLGNEQLKPPDISLCHQISEMLDYLADYVVTHFSAEENLMLTANSQNYIEHKIIHDDFTGVVKSLLSKYKAEGESNTLIVEVNYVAVNWLKNHICTLDRNLAELVNPKSQTLPHYKAQ